MQKNQGCTDGLVDWSLRNCQREKEVRALSFGLKCCIFGAGKNEENRE